MGNATRQMKRARAKGGQAAKKPSMPPEKKRKIAWTAGIAALVILLLVMFWSPTGAVKNWFGHLMFVSDSDLIVRKDNAYYSLGTFTVPAGYTADRDYSVASDSLQYEIKADADAADSPVGYFYLTPVSALDLDRIYSAFTSRFESTTAIREIQTHGMTAQLFSMSYPAEEQDTSSYLRNVCMYLPASRGCHILISLYSPRCPEDLLPDEDAMLAQLDTITAGLALK